MDTGFNLGQATDATEQAGVLSANDEEGLVFNLDEVEDKAAFEVMPKGTYDAIIEEFELTNSQSSGSPMISVIFSITTGEYTERKIFDYYVLTGEGAKYALPKLKQLITVTCPDIDASTFKPSSFAESGVIINRACRIVLGIQTQKKGDYAGEKRNTVKEIQAASLESSFLG